MAIAKPEQSTLSLRIICQNPPDVTLEGDFLGFGLQDKTEALRDGVRQPDGSVMYTCQALVKPRKGDGPPDFAGPYIHGVKGARFLYLSLRKHEGGFSKRIKVSLKPITWAQIGMLENGAGAGLTATVEGHGSGTVKLLGDGWTLYAA